MASRKRHCTGNLKRKDWVALSGELAWEEVMDLI
jgi:hypothetical protein